jgi:hypothetical protein
MGRLSHFASVITPAVRSKCPTSPG